MNYEKKHPILQKLEEYFKNTPKEQIKKDWSDILKDTDSEAYYEQKYNQALERAKEMCALPTDKATMEYIFPELKESEDDKIRKAIHIYLDWLDGRKDYAPKGDYTIRDMIAWLEKQGKQKPADMVEPKFHEGDWIISNNKKSTYQVIEVKRGIYVIRDNADNHEYHIGIEECEKSGRLWSISDAKDGDILVMAKDCSPFIFKGFDQFHPECPVAYGGIDEDDEFIPSNGTGWWDDGEIQPATKKQRDLLFEKMKKAGYE